MSWPEVTVVDACVRRDGRGGSRTAVTDDDQAATDADRRAVAAGGRPVRFSTAAVVLQYVAPAAPAAGVKGAAV